MNQYQDPYYFQKPDDFILYDIQKEGVEALVPAKKIFLNDEMGVGKSLQLLMANAEWKPSKVLICGSKNSTMTWMKEIGKWYPNLLARTRFIRGTKDKRLDLWKEISNETITIITYGILKSDLNLIAAIKWDAFYTDEAHKWKNKKTKTYKAVKRIVVQAKPEIIIPITGSRPRARELWAYISIVAPDIYPSYWKYMNRYHVYEDCGFGREIIGTQNMIELRELVAPYYLRRLKGDDMPMLTRSIVPLEMDKEQRKLYLELCNDFIAQVDEGLMVASTVLAARIRLRQLLVCPKLWNEDLGYGAALQSTGEHLSDNEINKAVIYTPFPAAFDYFEEFFVPKGYHCIRLRGGLEVEELFALTEKFQNYDGKILALQSIRFAESFDLYAGEAGYFLGCDDDPEQNYQAEARVHRRGLEHPVTMYYWRHQGTVEIEQLDILNDKVKDARSIQGNPRHFKKLLEDHKKFT